MSTTGVSPQAQLAEGEIDTAYRGNNLLDAPREVAVWHLLTVAEEFVLQSQPKHLGEASAASDRMKYALKHSLGWVVSGTTPGGRVPLACDDTLATNAMKLVRLATEYDGFTCAFVQARMGVGRLELQGSKLEFMPNDPMVAAMEAYGHLLHTLDEAEQANEIGAAAAAEIHRLTMESTTFDRRTFQIHFTPRLVKRVLDIAKVIGGPFRLPAEWRLRQYSLGEFRSVGVALATVALLQLGARYLAMTRCEGGGCDSHLLVWRREDLIRRLARYSGVQGHVVDYIVSDLTYGAAGTTSPDPALQPIVQLSDFVLLAPNLISTSALERNIVALANRIPSAKQEYLAVVQQKEALLRTEIAPLFAAAGARVCSVKLPVALRLPDIDLAVLDDDAKAGLILEIKWFNEPSEIREVIEKTEEIRKGIKQLGSLKERIEAGDPTVLARLGTGERWRWCFAVASANTVGNALPSDPDIHVVGLKQLLAKWCQVRSLDVLSQWLRRRSYLPVNNRDFEVVRESYEIGQWTLEWPGLRVTNPTKWLHESGIEPEIVSRTVRSD